MKTIVLAADHNGVETKEYLIKNLELDQNLAVRCIDLGPYNSVESVDYTDYSHQLSRLVSNQQLDLGILVCGTGVGMSIAANKVEGCRAALIHNTFSAPKSREHNDSNVLCLGAWVVDDEVNLEICKLWLQEDFGEGRHVRSGIGSISGRVVFQLLSRQRSLSSQFGSSRIRPIDGR